MTASKYSALGLADVTTSQANLATRTATSTTGSPAAGLFHSTVVNRAKMIDLSNDLGVRLGIDRFPTQSMVQVFGEQGPNGEPVYKPANDKFEQVRFVGQWGPLPNGTVNTDGQYVQTSSTASYVEFTFYGTGLNVLCYSDNNNRNMTVSTDGGSTSTVTNTTMSGTLQGRGYSPNVCFTLVSGLSLGIHTVKVLQASGTMTIFGFEILNEGILATTGNITSASNQLTSIANVTGVVAGLGVTGVGIPAGTTVSSISGTTVTMSANATATTSSLAITFTGMLKVASGSATVGAKKNYLNSVNVAAFNSTFETGTLGTKGGRVLVYLKSDGTIAKAVQPTAATANANGSSATVNGVALGGGQADHVAANEEVIRTYYWREFSAGRTDDFSTFTQATGTANRAFTLDDGTTTLVANQANNSPVAEGLSSNQASGAFVAFTFVGTGLDIIINSDNNTRQFDSVTIDGSASVGAIVYTAGTAGYFKVAKVVSGLPYGTHTIRFAQTSAAFSPSFNSFIVYGPKKPTLPSGAFELADYNVVANYVIGSAGPSARSTGVITKAGLREGALTGTWTIGLDTNINSGFNLNSSVAGAIATYTFFGTGVELKTNPQAGGATINWTFTVDNQALNAGTNTGSSSSIAFGTTTGASLSAAGVLTGTLAGSGQNDGIVSITGLPLGLHTVKVVGTNAGGAQPLYINSWDVITPIHVVKNNGPYVVQNALSVGSQGINDGRKFGTQVVSINPIAQCSRISNASTTTTFYVPIPDQIVTIKTNGGPIEINHQTGAFVASSSTGGGFEVFLNGLAVTGEKELTGTSAGGASAHVGECVTIPVPAGWYTIQTYYRSFSGASCGTTGARTIKATELKAS